MEVGNMPIIRNKNTGVVNEVKEEVAEYYLKFERDDYELVDGDINKAPAGAPEDTGSGKTVDEMEYPELQALAKLLGIPATGGKDKLIVAIKEAQAAE
jgi:hypothetical protein